MKAIALKPGQPESLHLRELPRPELDDVPEGRGILVKVLHVGLCGTDREIYSGLYGQPAAGTDFLILGHETSVLLKQLGRMCTGLRSVITSCLWSAGRATACTTSSGLSISPPTMSTMNAGLIFYTAS